MHKPDHLVERLSAHIDGELNAHEERELRRAMEGNGEQAALEQDLIALKSLAAQETPDPPPRIYHRLKEQVEATYGAKRPSLLSRWIPRLGWALAAALLLFIGIDQFPQKTTDQPADTLLRDVAMARNAYYQAIANLEQQALAKLDAMPPETARIFSKNLHVINRAIEDCENLVNQYPRDSVAYASLADAYHNKVLLLEKMLESTGS